MCAPRRGWRPGTVRDRRTRRDWADGITALVDVHEPQAEQLRLVLDTRTPHPPASRYAALPAAEAKRLADKVASHSTPKPGRWVTRAASEVRGLAEQCRDRRLPDRPTLERAGAAWEAERKATTRTMTWRFTTADARIKLKLLYPVFEDCQPTRYAAAGPSLMR